MGRSDSTDMEMNTSYIEVQEFRELLNFFTLKQAD
jgi:hypothetical protein